MPYIKIVSLREQSFVCNKAFNGCFNDTRDNWLDNFVSNFSTTFSYNANACVVGVLLIVMIVAILWGRRLRMTKIQATIVPMTRQESQKEIEIKGIEIKEQLGEGGFGVVYKGKWKGKDVALKKLWKSQEKENFLNEAHLLQMLHHPNIVEYLGVFKPSKDEMFIVMEYLPLGSLRQLILEEGKNLSIFDLIVMAKHIAAGMAHLEVNHIIHRDLSLRNILVGTFGSQKKYTAKISDFGLSRSIESSYYSSKTNIPIKWSAPEVIEYGTHTSKSDVYSYGVTLWEMFSYGRLPYAEYSNDVAQKLIVSGQLMDSPLDCPPEVFALILKCWNRSAKERPTFAQVLTEVDTIFKKQSEVSRTKSRMEINFVSKSDSNMPIYVSHEGVYNI